MSDQPKKDGNPELIGLFSLIGLGAAFGSLIMGAITGKIDSQTLIVVTPWFVAGIGGVTAYYLTPD